MAERDQIFCDNSTKVFLIKSVKLRESQIVQNYVTLFKGSSNGETWKSFMQEIYKTLKILHFHIIICKIRKMYFFLAGIFDKITINRFSQIDKNGSHLKTNTGPFGGSGLEPIKPLPFRHFSDPPPPVWLFLFIICHFWAYVVCFQLWNEVYRKCILKPWLAFRQIFYFKSFSNKQIKEVATISILNEHKKSYFYSQIWSLVASLRIKFTVLMNSVMIP